MTTRSDLENELLARLQVASNSTVFGASRLTQLIQNAYIWSTDILIWLDLVKAQTSNSVTGQEYYDYPDDSDPDNDSSHFKSGSIVRLELGGEPYARKRFEDYLAWKNQYPTSTDKIFASYGRQFFIWPVPTSVATLDVWGAIPAEPLSSSSSITIFSNNKEICNEAVVDKAYSVAARKTDPKGAQIAEASAITVLTKTNKDEWATVQRDQALAHPKFMVPDFFGKGSGVNSTNGPIGGFYI
jgi:hypothetical protein